MPPFVRRFRKMGIPTNEKNAKTLPTVVGHSVRPMDAGESNIVCGYHGWSGILCADNQLSLKLTDRLCPCNWLSNSTNGSPVKRPEVA